jgi:putative cell wall-binding protein
LKRFNSESFFPRLNGEFMHAVLGIGLTFVIAVTAITPLAPSSAQAATPTTAVAAASPTALDRTGWTVTASHSHPDTPSSNMLDGSLATGWTSGKGQQAFPEDPEFLVLDTGSASTFDTIELAAGGAVDDYARSYAVSVSDDGTAWMPVTSGNGSLTEGALVISLCEDESPCEPVTARYVRIEQTSWHYVNWWTVAELNLLVGESAPPEGGPARFLDRAGWSMTASQGWLPASNMLDGTVDTGWTTGDGQAAGQWIRLDAGSPVTFDGIDLAAGAAVSDYARGYAVDSSSDGENWTRVAEGQGALNDDGSVRISLCDEVATCAPATARFVRITQTSNHFINAWTVAELNLVIGDLAYLRPQATPRETMVEPGGSLELDIWGLAPDEPVRILAADGSLLATTAAGGDGAVLHTLTMPSAEGDFAFTVTGDWTGWRADLSVLVTSDVESTDPDPNDGECGTCPDDGSLADVGTIAISEDDGTISLDWPDVEDAVTYEVQRSTGRYSEFTAVATVDDSEYADEVGAEDKYRYYYRVTAVGAGEARSEASADASLEGALFGENMHVFSETDSSAEVDALISKTAQEMFPFASELSDERHAFAFKPGTYETSSINVGYYTSIYGLGETPLDTTVPRIEIPSQPADSLTNFWRSVENIGIETGSADTWLTWATSQAAPARRLWVNGKLHLDDWGKAASGGYLADSVITGETGSWSQQQYFLRNNDLTRGWYGGGWNHVFVGVDQAPTESPDWAAAGWNATTVEAETPVVREKPFLYLADSGDYEVFVPGLRTESTGVSWSEGDPGVGASLPIGEFHVARAGVDTAETLNAALADGKHLLLTPGVYEIDATLEVDDAETVVLGLGMATLRPVGGIDAMHVADVDGVTIAGVLFDATADGSDTLLQVGTQTASADHSDNPTLLADVFTRVGGAVEGKASVSVEINSSDVIGDHFWLWRADHGATAGATGWDKNTGANGLIVNGDRVTVYGLFVEHFQEYQTLWNGDDGTTFFYQSELPYDPPTQADYLSHDGTVNGYSSYKVTNEADGHTAVGLGVYDVFIHTDEWVVVENGIEVSPGTELRNAAIVSFGANGGQNHIVNGVGSGVSGGAAIKSGINSYVEPVPAVRATIDGAEPSDESYPAPVTVALELIEGTGTVEYRVDGGEWVLSSGTVELSEPGGHRVDYRVRHLGDVYEPASGGIDVTIESPTVEVDRLAGTDRFSTAVEVSEQAYPDGADVVFLASGTGFADALSAAPAAARLGGPVLLTAPGALPKVVADEIERLDPARVVVVGGQPSVATPVFVEVGGIAPVQRIGGTDRFDTSRKIARYAFGAEASAALIATGLNFPDALSAGAAIGGDGPVVLVNGGAAAADDATLTLLADLGVEQLFVAGDVSSVSAGVAASLEGVADTRRLAGADRYATSQLVNAEFFTGTDRVLLATGADFPDALAAAAWAPIIDAPLFTVPGTCVPEGVLEAISELGAERVTLLGGEPSLSRAVEELTSCG